MFPTTHASGMHNDIYTEKISQKSLSEKYAFNTHPAMRSKFAELQISMPINVELEHEEIKNITKIAYDCTALFYNYKPVHNDLDTLKTKLRDLRSDIGFKVMTCRNESGNRNLLFRTKPSTQMNLFNVPIMIDVNVTTFITV